MTREQILADKPACVTVKNGTGMPCTCDFACANYFIRALMETGIDDVAPQQFVPGMPRWLAACILASLTIGGLLAVLAALVWVFVLAGWTAGP